MDGFFPPEMEGNAHCVLYGNAVILQAKVNSPWRGEITYSFIELESLFSGRSIL